MSADPVVELVTNAIGYGVMSALEGREQLLAKLRAAEPGASMADVLRPDAERFIRTRADLVEAIR